MEKGKQRPQLITVDTNVLLDLAADNATVWECIETVRARLSNARFIVTPTVIQELADLCDSGNAIQKSLTEKALHSILKWGFQPINYVPVGHGIVEAIGGKIRGKGLIPETEENDSFVVAEAALLGSSILISNDRHLKDIPNFELKLVLDDCDVQTPLIVSPWAIAKLFPRL